MKTNAQLIEEIDALAPWHHNLLLRDGITTKSATGADKTGQPVSVVDVEKVFEHSTAGLFPNGLEGRSFLDCACNSAGYSFVAKDLGAGRVYAFDAREHWINQARFVAEHRVADSSNMTFNVATVDHLANLDDKFDVTWFSGIFYHLPDPVASLKLAADRTNELLILNTACLPHNPDKDEEPALSYRQEGTKQLMSGIDGPSWLPSGPKVLKNLLNWMGFSEVKVFFWSNVSNPNNNEMGGRIGMIAARQAGRLDAMTELTAPTTMTPQKTPAKTTQQVKTVQAAGRPLLWEDDISSNAADTAPFENAGPPCNWTKEEFVQFNSGRAPAEVKEMDVCKLAKRDTLPIPSGKDREGYNPGYDEQFWLTGLRDYQNVLTQLDTHKISVDRMLEMGCATGRVLRHFAVQSSIPEIWGTDINHRHVRWLIDHMPAHVRPMAVPTLPSLPVEDNYFDLITAFSVFTHIDTFETSHIAEIRRALKPGGMAYLTITNENTWDAMRGPSDNPAKNLAKRLLGSVPDFATALKHPLSSGRSDFRHLQVGPYRGISFHSTDHIEKVWGRFMTIEDIIPNGHGIQTVVVLRK
ncbi:MAG: class I SAM-dependent methyltransferase [Litoreibacter sp.]|uniref:class I SAM-dependent methyltransferase n=1 Tax=Litoreibacter sp. TaxID=1969459 RepID=UPI003299791D